MIKINSVPSSLIGEIALPASKSICNRALVIRSLSGNSFDVKNVSAAEDSQNLLKNLELLQENNSKSQIIDVGPAGTNMRFLSSFLAAGQGEYILQGSARMHQRPIDALVDVLKSLGANISYLHKEGYPPLKIKSGAMFGGFVQMPSDVSSQFISSLMMIGPVLSKGLQIELKGEPVSKSYIHMTSSIMEACGANLSWKENMITIEPTGYNRSEDFFVESDWSAASYWYAMAALSPATDLVLDGLHQTSFQGDAILKKWFSELGVKTEWEENRIHLTNTGSRHSGIFVRDFNNNPDLAQTFIPLLSLLKMPGKLSGLRTLRIKETDRIEAMKKEMAGFGVELNYDHKQDVLTVPPVRPKNKEQIVKTYKDHRMAMAMAMLGYAVAPLWIEEETVVGKSYPNYWHDLSKVGFDLGWV